MPKKKTGRPTDYTKELGDRICDGIGNGYSLSTVCSPEGMPGLTSVFKWMREDSDFANNYARATQERTEAQNESLLDMGDEARRLAETVDPKAANAVVSAIKLKADNLKWVMSKMKPKKYGDQLDLTTGGDKLPSPIMALPHVQPDNSNKQNQPPVEED